MQKRNSNQNSECKITFAHSLLGSDGDFLKRKKTRGGNSSIIGNKGAQLGVERPVKKENRSESDTR